jgi:hypothetical protein
MTKPGRLAAILGISAMFLIFLSLPLLATNEGGGQETPTETTIVTTDIQPAVEVTLPPETPAKADWTYRYLIPTGIALAILIVVATSGQYFANVVRKRYRIVEE